MRSIKYLAIPEKLMGDERRLKQVLINLVKNALKFTKNGSSITMKACFKPQEKLLVVHVSDTGQGIVKEDINKLF